MPSERTCVTTPESLAVPFVDLTLRRLIEWTEPDRGGTVLDPGCGSGLFLKLLGERLPRDQNWLFKGVEVEKALAETAADNLQQSDVQIYHGDFLFDGWREVRGEGRIWEPGPEVCRVVIGNPPYLGFKSQGAALRLRLSKKYGPGFGKCDLSGFSLIRSLSLVEHGGLIALILPRYWLEGGTGKVLRDYLTQECDQVEIRQWPGGHLFPGTGVQVLGLWARKRLKTGSRGRMHYYLLPEKVLDGEPLGQRVSDWSADRGPWPLLLKSEERLLDLLRSQGLCLDDWAAPAQGIITGADRSKEGRGIFVLDPNEAGRLQLSAAEKRHLHPWIKSKQLEPMRIGKSSASLLHVPPGTDLNTLPAIRDHLLSFKSRLEQRREVQNGRIPWWALQWGRKPDLFQGVRILMPAKARVVRAAPAPEGICFSADIYTWRLRDQVIRRFQGVTARQAVFWLALYFSSRLGRLSSRLLGKKLGSVVELYPQTQRQVPVPDPDETGWREIAHIMRKRFRQKHVEMLSVDELYNCADESVDVILKPSREVKNLLAEIEDIWDPPS